ncbi:hypothetical protein GT040_24535, partial [Streptomyces sp. SID2119]|nr:hypothetical protein [Streptomyces sp. SID2119]
PKPSDASDSPGSSDPTPEDGLLGGGTDGLLDDLPTDGLSQPSPEDKPSTSPRPAPDVTLPPLLPGLLPGLGIDGENLKPKP